MRLYRFALIGRYGMPMCKYYYRSGLCANSSIQSPFCVGDSQCPAFNETKMKEYDTPNTMITVEGTESEKWLGLYCSTYKRFHCTGEAECGTGHCADADAFLNHLAIAKGETA